MFTTMTDQMKKNVPISRKTLQNRMGISRKAANWMLQNLLETGTIRRVLPIEVGSGKYHSSENATNEEHDKMKDKKRKDRKRGFEKKRRNKFNVFVLV